MDLVFKGLWSSLTALSLALAAKLPPCIFLYKQHFCTGVYDPLWVHFCTRFLDDVSTCFLDAYAWMSNCSNTICWQASFPPVNCFLQLCQKSVERWVVGCVGLFLGSQLHSTELCVSLHQRTTLSWWLRMWGKTSYKTAWHCLLDASFSDGFNYFRSTVFAYELFSGRKGCFPEPPLDARMEAGGHWVWELAFCCVGRPRSKLSWLHRRQVPFVSLQIVLLDQIRHFDSYWQHQS